jgi:hypothetical protein
MAYAAPAPDYTFLTAVLALTNRYTVINEPLMFSNSSGTTPHSNPQSFDVFTAELDSSKRGGWAPIKLPVVCPWNIIAESMGRIKELMPRELAAIDFDIPGYLEDYKRQMMEFEDIGFDVRYARAKLEEFMAQQPAAVQFRVNSRVYRHRVRLRVWNALKARALTNPRLERLSTRLTRLEVVRGSEAGFSNIFEAATLFGETLAPLRRAATP